VTEVIDVDTRGVALNGETFDDIATKRIVAKGYMTNETVLLRFPDGKVKKGNRIRVTPRGLEALRRELPVADRPAEGTA
jgi:hypothetical protein